VRESSCSPGKKGGPMEADDMILNESFERNMTDIESGVDFYNYYN